MVIGIPKAMSYYMYSDLWDNFFKNLGDRVIVSRDTDNKILDDGIKYSIDENCLASKIFMGHVYSLIDKCDYIFIPRFCSFKNGDIVCVKFNGLYDICKNTFKNINLLTYDIDYKEKKTSIKAVFDLADKLNVKHFKALNAYMKALNALDKIQEIEQGIYDKKIQIYKNNLRPNILIVAHPYVYNDKFVGLPIISYLKENGCNVIFSDKYDKEIIDGWQNYSKSIYFRYNKQSMTGINYYYNIADGIIFLSVFPCGSDALANELCIRKIKDKPAINLVIDQQGFDAGVETRLESFVDILNIKKKVELSE